MTNNGESAKKRSIRVLQKARTFRIKKGDDLYKVKWELVTRAASEQELNLLMTFNLKTAVARTPQA